MDSWSWEMDRVDLHAIRSSVEHTAVDLFDIVLVGILRKKYQGLTKTSNRPRGELFLATILTFHTLLLGLYFPSVRRSIKFPPPLTWMSVPFLSPFLCFNPSTIVWDRAGSNEDPVLITMSCSAARVLILVKSSNVPCSILSTLTTLRNQSSAFSLRK